jgi:hypothetical protein
MGIHSEESIEHQQNENNENCDCVKCIMQDINMCGCLIKFKVYVKNEEFELSSYTESKVSRDKLVHLITLAILENKEHIEGITVSRNFEAFDYTIDYLYVKKLNENEFIYIIQMCFHNNE